MPGQVVVMFRDAIPISFPVEAAEHGVIIDRSDGLKFVAIKTLPDRVPEVIQEMKSRHDVLDAYQARRVWPLFMPNDPEVGSQWAINVTHIGEAWNSTVGNHSVKVAVLDTGIQMTHDDLRANTELGDPACGPNANFAEDPDIRNHGTHVAGIVGAVTNNSLAVAGTSQSCIMDVKVIENCMPDLTQQDMCPQPSTGQRAALGVEWATTHGADIISMSFRTDVYDPALSAALESAWQAGIVLVAAAGNDGCPNTWLSPPESITFPGSHHRVIAVGALDNATSISYFSACGSNMGLAAPGRNILSTYATTNNGTVIDTGTSMAAPFVSGVAALMLSPGIASPSLTNVKVRCILENSADDLGAPGWDGTYGFGRLNASWAMRGAANPALVEC
ncbi:MAG: S8 family peptidase [Methanobacteriota archaeon]